MRTTHMRNIIVVSLSVALHAPACVFAQQVPVPKTAAEVPGPASESAMTKEYVQTVGRMAYVWRYAMVNSHNRRIAFAYVTGPDWTLRTQIQFLFPK